MKKSISVVLVATACFSITAYGDDKHALLEFEGGIGSQPFASGAGGVPVPNDVKGIPPGGRPWPIGALKASVRSDGTISVKGKGMLLGSGANIGRPAIPRQVVATIFCGDLAMNSAPTDLDAADDFKINSALSAIPPDPCIAPILLIRNDANGTPGPWFAAGIQKFEDDD
jgi:hypothetical protein